MDGVQRAIRGLQHHFQLTVTILGEHHDHEARLLNRVVTWDADGWSYAAEDRHAQILLDSLGLTQCKIGVGPQPSGALSEGGTCLWNPQTPAGTVVPRFVLATWRRTVPIFNTLRKKPAATWRNQRKEIGQGLLVLLATSKDALDLPGGFTTNRRRRR